MATKHAINIQAKNHLPEALKVLAKLPKNEDGRISWESSQLERGTFELIYNLTFKPVDDYVKDGAIWHVLNECARGNDFSSKFFIAQLHAYLGRHFSKEPKSLIAISQINASVSAGLPNRLPSPLGPIEIRSSLSKIDREAIAKFHEYKQNSLGLHQDFIYLTCRVAATDDRAALDAAYQKIKFSLGLLNLFVSGYGVSKRFGLPNAPIGQFMSASSIFTIHRTQRVIGNYFSENHYPLAWKQSFSVWRRVVPREDIQRVAKAYVTRFARLDFKEPLIRSIVLFQEGLEAVHIDIALLKFWTGIEVLCAREEREATERIIERVSSIFIDQSHASIRLNFIQEFRNKIVHRGEAGDHSLLCAQWGSIYLAHLIEFCLFNNLKIKTRADLLAFLSTPAEKSKLIEALSIYRRRLRSIKKSAAG
jgi:hypothetical protein